MNGALPWVQFLLLALLLVVAVEFAIHRRLGTIVDLFQKAMRGENTDAMALGRLQGELSALTARLEEHVNDGEKLERDVRALKAFQKKIEDLNVIRASGYIATPHRAEGG